MVAKKVHIVVDEKFFNNIFDKERRRLQNKIGVTNLSQANFTKMIEGFKIRKPKMDLSQVNTRVLKKRRKRNANI
jgi:hypothetical protein